MRARLVRHQTILWFFALMTTPGLAAMAEIKATATRSHTVQAAGLRQGEAGSRYFNIGGVKKDRYASFGLLVFERSRSEGHVVEVGKMNLPLVQGKVRCTQDGKMRFFLAEPADRSGEPLAGLKFEAGSPGGVAMKALKALHPPGSGIFVKGETGRANAFELKPDEAGKRYLRDRVKASGTVLIVAVSEDEEVAATYFGAGAEPKGNQPQVIIDGEPAK
jgi:hypothetical protein